MNDAMFETSMFLMWGIVLAVGAVLAWVTLRSATRGPSRPMLALGLGLALVGVAAPAFWLGGYLMTGDLELCSFGTAGLTAVGFLAILYSIRTRSGERVAAAPAQEKGSGS